MMTTRRNALRLALACAAVPLAVPGTARAEVSAPVLVWKDPGCGCCEGWVGHMRAAGFSVSVRDTADMDAVKLARGVPEALVSCHTALVGGYVVEGHVPAPDIRRLLAERPAAKGLAVPGMPQSAPGMDQPGEPYSVVLFGAPAGSRIYARH
jgi:hypothetical protein